jgi:hypothetical protein
MNMLKIFFIANLFTLLLSQQASAEPGDKFIVEDFHYGYEPTGVPKIDLQITNQGAEVERPEIVVRLSEAVPTMLNDYDYKLRSTVQADNNPTLLPNQKFFISLMAKKLLKAGDYEALVTIKFSGKKEMNRFEFSVNEADVHGAQFQIAANHIEFPLREKSKPIWTWLVTVFTFFCVIAAWIKFR